MSFKNPWTWKSPQKVWLSFEPLTDAQRNHQTLCFLYTINSQATAKRLTKNLTDIRDQCRDLGLREAADCFDTALEATEEGMKALGKEKD